MNNKLPLTALALLFLFSCNQQDQDLRVQSGDLIGGHQAAENLYKSTVTVNAGCTASKVAPKAYILAAHCVLGLKTDGEIRGSYLPMQRLILSTHYKQTYTVTVKETLPHESYVKALKDKLAKGDSPNNVGLTSYDVALILLEDDTPQIPVAVLNKGHVKGNEKIIIGGYGCEEAISKKFDYSTKRYKVSANVSMEWEDVVDVSKLRKSKEEWSIFYKYNFLSKGKGYGDEFASLCPGDSGGPVYLESDNSLIGINSYYHFIKNDGVSYLNTHTRISAVYDWIKASLKKSQD